MILTTTLNKIRESDPCVEGWEKLLKHLGKTKADDEELTFQTILESNGLDDALWCLRCVNGRDKEIRLFSIWCARQVENFDKSGASKKTNDISERYANGQATSEELDAACDAAWAAASAEACAAACDAAWAAASAEACAAARDAAWAAASAEACAAARDAQKEQFIKQFCTGE